MSYSYISGDERKSALLEFGIWGLGLPFCDTHRFSVYCSLPSLLCPGVLMQHSTWGQIIQGSMHHPGRAGAAAVGNVRGVPGTTDSALHLPPFAVWMTCQSHHSTSHKAPWCSMSCPFSHPMPCTMWLLKIFFTHKQQKQPFKSLPPAGDGVDAAWRYSLVWEDSLCACPHLSKICTGTQVWKSHPQRIYWWAD